MVGCGRSTPYRQVSLTPQPEIEEVPVLSLGTEIRPLRVAVAAILSPQSTSAGYDPLVAYLTDRLGQPVQLVQRATYAEINELVRTRQVDLAFICTGAYIQGQRDFGMELLAIPEVNGKITYQSYIIVAGDDAFRQLDDLRAHVFAFTDPMSLSGYLVPLRHLRSEGESPDTFFGRTLFTYSHENSIRAVVDGWADGAAVDSLVYEAMVAQELLRPEKARVIWRSDPYGLPPVVVHPGLDSRTRDQFRSVLLQMDQDAEGREALRLMGIDRLVPADDRLYDSARVVLEQMEAMEQTDGLR